MLGCFFSFFYRLKSEIIDGHWISLWLHHKFRIFYILHRDIFSSKKWQLYFGTTLGYFCSLYRLKCEVIDGHWIRLWQQHIFYILHAVIFLIQENSNYTSGLQEDIGIIFHIFTYRSKCEFFDGRWF